jgi:hypothetical protein
MMDNLPSKIKGKALWTDHTNPRQSTYYICIQKYHYPVEYINERWYHISWDTGTYHTKEGHEITQHLTIGLGTKKAPYLEEVDAAHVHSKESDETKPTTASKTNTEPSKDQDTLVVTYQESQIIDQLASIMSTMTVTIPGTRAGQPDHPGQATQTKT